MNRINHQYSRLWLPLILVLFILSRLGYLNLPYYWDEAWSYATAILDMNKTGPVIIPGYGNPELTRGHPLLFYFLSAVWTRAFGTSLTMVHLFPLLISVFMLTAVFYTALDWFDRTTAYAATFLVALQSVFLAQSTMLLPEIMLALWTLLTVYMYFRKRWAWFVIFSVLLVMTKETGMVLTVTLLLDKLLLEGLFKNGRERPARLLFQELSLMCIPVVIFAGSLLLQKIRYGWFLYPGHLDLTVLNHHEIISGVRTLFSKLLLQHGRNIFLFAAIAALIYRIAKKRIDTRTFHLLLFSGIFITLYITFSSVNFFTTRYLMSALPFYIIPGAWLITATLRKGWMKITVVSVLVLLAARITFKVNLNENDTSLGFKNTVLLQKQAVNFAEQMHWQEKSVYSAFLMQYYLSNPGLGYLHNAAQPFEHVSNWEENTYDLFIFCSNEGDPRYPEIIKRPDVKLLKRFEQKSAWVEVYGIRNQ